MMPRKKATASARKKRFRAASIPILAPKTMARGKKQQPKTRSKHKKSAPGKGRTRLQAWGLSHYFALLLIIGSLATLGLLFMSARFQINAPQISTSGVIDASQVQQQAAITHANIFTIDPTEVSIRLQTALPQIKEAKVRLGLPHQAMIQVVVRTPVLVYNNGHQTLWVDETGHLFPVADSDSALPQLIDEDGTALTPDYRLDAGIWQAIQQLNAMMPTLTEFHHRQVYGLFFISPEGWRVYLGDGADISAKVALWQSIRQQILQENRSIKVVDLRNERIYIQ